MENFESSIISLSAIIFTGLFLKLFFIKSDEFWRNIEKLTYYVFFPSLLIVRLSKENFEDYNFFFPITILILATSLVAITIFSLKPYLNISNSTLSSVFQGGVRYNSYVFIALASSLGGDNGVAISAIIIAYMIIFTNAVSIMALCYYNNENKKFREILLSFAKNPLIIGALIGCIFSYFRINLIQPIELAMTNLGNASLALGLLSVGAGLKFQLQRSQWYAIFFSSSMKLIMLPVITILMVSSMDISQDIKIIMVMYSSLPCAGNAYILSRQMGGDSDVMASIITFTTLFSLLTIPVFLAVL